jgi:hypothetical protein
MSGIVFANVQTCASTNSTGSKDAFALPRVGLTPITTSSSHEVASQGARLTLEDNESPAIAGLSLGGDL